MKTREWLLLILIIILVQFIVQSAAWLYGTDDDVLDYISFVGTIVSIILAVLAIVYSFFQTISQQSSAEKISGQVDKLVSVGSRLELSKDGLSGIVRSLSVVTQRLDQTIAHQGVIGTKVDGIASVLSAVEKAALQDSKSSFIVNSGEGQPVLDSRNPLARGFGGFNSNSIFLYFGMKAGLTVGQVFKQIVVPVIGDLVVDYGEEFISYNEGLYTGIWQSLMAGNHIVPISEAGVSWDDIDFSECRFKMSEEFEGFCEYFSNYYSDGSLDGDDESEDGGVSNNAFMRDMVASAQKVLDVLMKK